MRFFIFFAIAFLVPKSALAAMELGLIPKDMADVFATGDFYWEDLLTFGFHIIQYLLELSAILAVIFLMYGGFQYIFGSLSDDKSSGKNTIIKTLIGLVVILLAWIIVDIFVTLVTAS
jgi:uncharacterized membrane-anchored protein